MGPTGAHTVEGPHPTCTHTHARTHVRTHTITCTQCQVLCHSKVMTVYLVHTLESHTYVCAHMRVSVNIIVLFFRPGPNKVSSINFPKPEGMPRLSAYVKERVVRLWQQGKKPAQIMRELVEEDIVTTRHTVTHWIFCWTKCTRSTDHSR